MSTTMDPNFLVAVMQMTGFKKERMFAAQAALFHLALRGLDFSAADLPGEVTGGSRHLAGAATGALISQGFLVVVGRMKSPHENAKGRKLDVLRMAQGKRSTIITWLERNGLPAPKPGDQLEMAV